MSSCCLQINAEGKQQSFPKDPTRTLGIRKRWIGQFEVRFRALKGRINELLLRGDNSDLLLVNQFEFTSNPNAVVEFLLWLQIQIDQTIFGNRRGASDAWQNQYIDQAYLRGIRASKAELRKLGFTAEQLAAATPAQLAGTLSLGLATGVGLRLIDLNTIHLDAVRLLHTRDFAALKGITDEMSKQIARVLVEAIEQGLGTAAIAKLINDRVDKIGKTRSKLLARTEVIRAYNVSTINEFKILAQQLGIEPQYQWITAGDSRVRPTHAERNRVVYDEKRAYSLIGEPNCRCALKPYFGDEI